MAPDGCEDLPDDWLTTATVIRETCQEMFDVSPGQRTDDKGTWCTGEYSEEGFGEEEMG